MAMRVEQHSKGMKIQRRSLLKASVVAATSGLVASFASSAEVIVPGRVSAPVSTTSGKVCGLETGGTCIFSGVPYGGPTGGSNRFLPATIPPTWTGVRLATQVPPRCIQAPGSVFDIAIGDYFSGGQKDRLRLGEQRDSEDCLYLNVLSQDADKALRRPVMVYIHGGGFASGSGVIALGADRFVREQDIVLVSVNHRLNVFGYLYLADFSPKYADSGNVGLLDLVLALRWVRDNIANFGGDPDNVTVFGESGGGAKISALMAMPAAQGLFGKAIVESGSALRVSTREEATETAGKILARLGLLDRVEELHNLPATKLFEASRADSEQNPNHRLGPVLDKRSIPQQTWDPKAPDLSAKIPMIIGSCKDEATLFMGGKDGENFSLNPDSLRVRLVEYLKLSNSDVDRLIDTYKTDRPASTPSDIFFAIASDRMFRINAITQAERKVQQGASPVYMYSFVYDTRIESGKYRAFHTAELPLVLRMVKYPETERLSQQLSAAWATFARNGNPNSKAVPRWPVYEMRTRETMTFGLDTKVVSDPSSKERIAMQRLGQRGSAL